MAGWVLHGFLEAFHAWVDRGEADDDRQVIVMAWIHSLQNDPYRGVVRRLDLGINYWFAIVPGSEDETHAVTCLYEIEDAKNAVYCDVIATLRHPIA